MQSVIVYRNPLEAMIWESLMSGGAPIFLVVIGAALAGLFVYAAIERYHRRAYHTWRWSDKKYGKMAALYIHSGKISVAVSLLILVAFHMWYIS